MRKTILTAAAALLFAANGFSQNINDALRFSQQIPEGTARSVGMGNAMVALGGDAGALTINPAASGVYRYSEVTLTPSISSANSSVNYLGTSSSFGKTTFGISNFGYIGSFNTGRRNSGLINWNVGVIFNRQNHFLSNTGAYGRTNESSWLGSLAASTSGIYAPSMDIMDNYNPFFESMGSWNSVLGWNSSLLDTLGGTGGQEYIGATENIQQVGTDEQGNPIFEIMTGGDLNQRYRSSSTGNITEAVLNFGTNFSNKLFIGINLGIQSIYYKYNETYNEDAVNLGDFQTGFVAFHNTYRYKASGTGINLKAGIIYKPVAGLRIGASISTPTWMFLSEEWENGMSAHLKNEDGSDYRQNLLSPLGTYDYRLNTPFRWNIGAAYTLGSVGVLSIDYEQANYRKAKLMDDGYDTGYESENQEIRSVLGTQDIVRVGAEINVSRNAAIRAGYQYYSSAYNGQNSRKEDVMHLGSLGIGYNSPSGFFADLAYQQKLKNYRTGFSLYDDYSGVYAPVGTEKTNRWKLLLSIGIRF